MGIISEEILNNFFENKLNIYCPKLTLTQKGVSENPIIYQGNGVIRKISKGRFDLDFIPLEKYKLFNDLQKRRSVAGVGKLIPDQYYFELSGIDIHHFTWFSPKVDIDFHESKDSIITGEFTELHFQKEKSYGFKSFQIYFDDEIQLPDNNSVIQERLKNKERQGWEVTHDITEFETSDLSFEIAHEDLHPNLYAVSKSGIEINIEIPNRVVDSLRFLTGQLHYTRLLIKSSKKGSSAVFISERMDNYYKPLVRAPINIYRKGKYYDDLSSIFDNYLAFISKDKKEKLAKIITRSIRGSVGNFYTHAVTISFGIEELIKSYFLDAQYDCKEEEIDDAIRKISDNDIDLSIKERIINALKSFKSPSVTDILYHLANYSSIEKNEIVKWKKLRGKVAHPGSKEYSTDELIELIEPTLTLFYSIVFILIGYNGTRTNYGSRWVQEEFTFDSKITPKQL